MTSKKNENRTSTVKGIIANPQTQTFEQFEIETAYTRSAVKAVEMAREILNLDNSVMISVTEIVNQPLVKVQYDAQSLIENMRESFGNQEEAESAAEENESVIEYELYAYSGQIWAVAGEEYVTEFVRYFSTVKHTKVDARAFIKMRYEQENDSAQVIGIHGDERKEQKQFAVIGNEQLANVKTR